MFDDDDDGHLSVSELREVVTSLGDRLTHTELNTMISQVFSLLPAAVGKTKAVDDDD
jgi:Ca2+-binding EF-hand superfamily protein